MRKIVLLLCLLPALCLAETEPQLDSIRQAAFDQLGIPAAGTDYVTTAKANAIVNYGIQEVSTSFPAVEKLDTITIDSTTEGGTLASDFVAIKWCLFIADDTARVPLEFAPVDSLFPARGGEEGVDHDPGNPYGVRYYFTHAKQLMTYPRWSVGADSALFLVAYYAVGNHLAAGGDSTNILPEYRDELLDWICYRLEALRGRFTAAAFYEAIYDKAKKERGFKK